MRDIKRVNLGFFEILATVVGSALTVDGIIKSMENPKISSVSIPGTLGLRDIAPSVLEEIEESKQKLKVLHQAELELAKQQEELEKRIAQREALKQKIIKIAPYVVVIGVILGVYFLIKRSKK